MTETMKERIECAEAGRCSAETFYPNETAGRIQAGVDSFRRREGKPANVLFSALRKKYGL